MAQLVVQDNVNVVLTPPITAQNRGGDVAAALRRMQIDLEKAEEIGAAGADLVRSILTPEHVRRCDQISGRMPAAWMCHMTVTSHASARKVHAQFNHQCLAWQGLKFEPQVHQQEKNVLRGAQLGLCKVFCEPAKTALAAGTLLSCYSSMPRCRDSRRPATQMPYPSGTAL